MMIRLIVLAAVSLLSAPAFAQGSLEQPATPDDGVGVDYTQPHMNDLLLRSKPLNEFMPVRTFRMSSCVPEFNAWKANPADQNLKAAVETCAAQQKQVLRELDAYKEELRKAMPGPGPTEPLYRIKPGIKPTTPRLPLAPDHPNAQH